MPILKIQQRKEGPLAALATTIGSSTIGSTILGSVGSALASRAFGGGQSAESPAVAAKPAVMPTADDSAIAAAKRRRVADLQSRQGRVSTILSDGDTLG